MSKKPLDNSSSFDSNTFIILYILYFVGNSFLIAPPPWGTLVYCTSLQKLFKGKYKLILLYFRFLSS